MIQQHQLILAILQLSHHQVSTVSIGVHESLFVDHLNYHSGKQSPNLFHVDF